MLDQANANTIKTRGPSAKPRKWIAKWVIKGLKGETFIVRRNPEGQFSCTCPIWRYRRHECKHIQEIKSQLEYRRDFRNLQRNTPKPDCVVADVEKPTFVRETNQLLLPVKKAGDVGELHMEATICHTMLKFGFTMEEVREIRNMLPDHLNAQKIRQYIDEYGEARYPSPGDTPGPQ